MLEANGLVFDAVTVRAQCGTFAAMQCRRPHLQLRPMAPFGASWGATSMAPPTRARIWPALAGVRRWHLAALVCCWCLHGMLPACARGTPHCPSPTVAAGLHNPARLMTASSRHSTSGHSCTGADKTPRTASPSADSSSTKVFNLHSGACSAYVAWLYCRLHMLQVPPLR